MLSKEWLNNYGRSECVASIWVSSLQFLGGFENETGPSPRNRIMALLNTSLVASTPRSPMPQERDWVMRKISLFDTFWCILSLSSEHMWAHSKLLRGFGFVALQLYDLGHAPRPSGKVLQSAIESPLMVEKGRTDGIFLVRPMLHKSLRMQCLHRAWSAQIFF